VSERPAFAQESQIMRMNCSDEEDKQRERQIGDLQIHPSETGNSKDNNETAKTKIQLFSIFKYSKIKKIKSMPGTTE